jgi:hypothetical protein
MAVVTAPMISDTEVAYFSPEDFIITPIRRAMANSQDVRIRHPGSGNLFVCTTRGEYFFQGEQIQGCLSAPASSFEIKVLDQADVSRPPPNTIGRNIDELMWMAAFYASRGRLMKGCFRDDVVQIRHWPNFSRLPMTPNAMRITALLARHPTSITLAQRLLKIEAAEIYQFYSAARCAGLAHVLNRKPEEPILKPHRNQALLGMLLSKIAGL